MIEFIEQFHATHVLDWWKHRFQILNRRLTENNLKDTRQFSVALLTFNCNFQQKNVFFINLKCPTCPKNSDHFAPAISRPSLSHRVMCYRPAARDFWFGFDGICALTIFLWWEFSFYLGFKSSWSYSCGNVFMYQFWFVIRSGHDFTHKPIAYLSYNVIYFCLISSLVFI